MKFKSVSTVLFIALIFIASITVLSKINTTKRENAIVLNKIEQLQQLVTAKQIYREVIYSKETGDFLWIPLKNKEFLFALDYTITAGINVSKGYSVRENNGYKTITLPRAEIISIDADDTTIKEYFVKQRFSTLTRDDYFQLITDSKQTILLGDSIESLLLESEENARILLLSLLQIANIDVQVDFSNRVIKENR